MEPTKQQFVSMAHTVCQQHLTLQGRRLQETQQLAYAVGMHLARIDTVRRLLDKALGYGWFGAAKRLAQQFEQPLRELPYATEQLQRQISLSDQPLPKLRQVFEDLCQLRQEFDRVDYDPQEQTLSVSTDAIELEGIFLGDFEIRLYLKRLAEMHSNNHLKIVALDPHPATCNETVTHPHVSDGYLCAGDAAAAMDNAVGHGRLCDFFLLARAVLGTYNSHSPYVSLDDWEGISCYACGYTVSGDDVYYCESCGNEFCEDCVGWCSICQTSFCQGCLSACPVCEEDRCEGCMTSCQQCGEPLCKSCVQDDLCPTCQQESEEPDDEPESKSETEPLKQSISASQDVSPVHPTDPTPTAVLADGLGQAALLPGPV